MKKVIFLKYSPLTRKVYDDYCMEYLSDHGFSVEYWDITKLFNFENIGLEEFFPNEKITVFRIRSYKDLAQMIEENQKKFFISLMSCYLNQWKLLRILSQKNVVFSSWGPAPLYVEKKTTSERLKRVTLKKIFSLLENYFMKFLLKTKIIRYYSYYFSVGLYGYQSIGLNDKNLLKHCKRLPVHSFDYNIFNYSDYKQIEQKKYIVFIDQYFPFHPDFYISGVSSIPSTPYYKILNSTLSRIEKALSMKVVIAAHPKAVKYKEHNYFEGRTVFWGETQSLIRNAQLVLAHSSTAIYQAIMAHKPIYLLDTYLFLKYLPNHSQIINSLRKKFQLPLIKMEDNDKLNISLDKLLLSDKQKLAYDNFLFEYCTSSDINKPNQELLTKYLTEILNCKTPNL